MKQLSWECKMVLEAIKLFARSVAGSAPPIEHPSNTVSILFEGHGKELTFRDDLEKYSWDILIERWREGLKLPSGMRKATMGKRAAGQMEVLREQALFICI
jgi:hypothetical protein